mgnify:CR=1 FL=1
MVYNFLMTFENGSYYLISMDYKIVVEGGNRAKLIERAEKLLKNKIKKDGMVHPVSEDKILEDLEEVDIYELIQITVWISS